MIPAIDIFDSPGARRVITCLDGPERPHGVAHFPANLRDGTDLRVSDHETLYTWFRRVIGDDAADDRIMDCALEDGLAFFGKLTWRDGVILEGSFQALVIKDTDLVTYYSEDNHKAQYYRFDIHPQKPGKLFAEPHPHIHCIPDGAPRFPFCWHPTESCLVAFLEFIYRNHFYKKWFKWVRSMSARSVSDDRMEEIIGVFENENDQVHTRAEEFRPDLVALANALRQGKAELVRSPLAMSPLCAALTY